METRPDETTQLLIGAGAAIGAFVCLAVVERMVGVSGWERSATTTVFGWPDIAGTVLWPANELGNRLVAVVIAGAVGWRRGVRSGVVVAAGAIAASVIASIAKAVVDRPRISAVELGGTARDVVHSASFPSSHVAVAVAVAVGVALALPRARWRWALVPVAALTAVARLWIGVHLPLDLVGGALVGIGAASGAAFIGRRLP